MAGIDEFYEQDEPVDDVAKAFERGPKQVTGAPRGQTEYLTVGQTAVRGWTRTLDLPGLTTTKVFPDLTTRAALRPAR
jgi:hypothetical protein